MRADEARTQLAVLLQLAYSGELGAIRAYLGHRAALRSRDERADLMRIIRDEVRHRHCVLRMLASLDAAPDPRRERKMERVGWAIATSCAVGGWFAPMYGAGRLERDNVGEYERAARLAIVAGCEAMVEPLLEMAEVEWDHEAYFRAKASSHPFWRLVPEWPSLPPRAHVRSSFAAWLDSDRAIPIPAVPWLVR